MRDFLKYVLASFVSLLLFGALGVGALTLGLVSLVALGSRTSEPEIKSDSVLVVDLSTPITDAPPSFSFSRLVDEGALGQAPRSLSLREAIGAIDAASTDERITGLYITDSRAGERPGLTLSRELRQALERFKAEDKPIFAYGSGWDERAFYLASVADTLILNPNGLLEFNGLSVETPFFAGALEKFGVGVSAIRAGDYKSAVEPFVRSSRSPEEEAQTQALLGDLWQEMLTVASESRDLSQSALEEITNRDALLLPEAALEADLVDQVAYADEVLPQLQELTGEDEDDPSFRQISLPLYADRVLQEKWGGDEAGSFSSPHIAVVYAEGGIVSGSGGTGQIGGDRLSALLRKLRLDENVKAVVLRINSAGGSAAASDIIAREVALTAEEKPVVASMGAIAASGGYLIATHADTIYASPTTLTGSIGVFGLFPNFQELANDNGVTWDVVKTSPLADIGTVTRPPSPQEVAIAQRFVNGVYDDFLARVSESRPISRSEVEAVAEGRVWSGRSAAEVGLVDELGGLEAAIAEAAERADLDPSALREYPGRVRLEDELREIFSSRSLDLTQHLASRLPKALRPIQAEVELLQSLDDPAGVYMRLPRHYEIR
ncbi:MAG: signal peptide peptidase SppA [Cyanobacteria bacterium P01_A01_bin.135]